MSANWMTPSTVRCGNWGRFSVMSWHKGDSVSDAFRGLFGRSDQYALLVIPDHTVLEGTTAARRLFGLDEAGIVPVPEFPSTVAKAIDEAFQGEGVRLELVAPTPDGERTFDVTVQPVGTQSVVEKVLLLAVANCLPRSRRDQESELLVRIALAVSQTDDVSLAVEQTLRHICQATGWVLGEAWVLRPVEGGEPVLGYCGEWTSEKRLLQAFTAQAAGLRFRRGEGIPGTAWGAGAPVWVSDLRTSGIFTRRALAAAARLEAAVSIPLVYAADDEIVAILQFFMREVPADNEQLVQLVSAVAAPLAQLLRQKQSDGAHRLAEARFTGIVSTASDAIISIDGSRRITLFNWGAERIFGYSAAEALGQLVDILLPEELRSRHAAHIVEFARSSDITRRMGERSRIVGLRKNGEIFPAEGSISRLSSGGEWVYTVILRDVSERIRTEEELRVLAERMRKAAESRDEVMALVSHDLRNPLSTISMCLSGLRDDPPPTPDMANGLVVLAEESALLMSRMIQDLLDIASIDAGRLSIDRVRQTIGPTLRRAVDMHRLIGIEQGISVAADVPSEMDQIAVMIDGERIVQVLSNLIGNACKFTDAGGSVVVSAAMLPDAVQVTVRDTGRGVPVDAIPHVFDRFWHARRGAAQRSTGLGLAIARGIIEAHDGRIRVESTVGQGSAFHFTVPSTTNAVREWMTDDRKTPPQKSVVR